ncbi:MAG TPA: 3-hydroxyacyl-CoA dehydrogenase NAD-binding domain-containing protein, partial [Methylocella sp.]|nr:3-hydroxyacyl-CoA dehydrogenase NAD-binding domain-containing protein [Methylocella sp.]
MDKMDINKMGVIGAGQMGTGIAQVCAVAGIEVALNDISEARINAGLATIAGNLARQVERKQLEPSARDAALNRITPALDFDAFSDSDLVIEAATENEEIKRKIFSRLCASLKPTAILATNTSSISITRLASITDRPERFIGIHFMNP